MHHWICDSGYSSHLVVDANIAGVEVPREFVTDGNIVLNIDPNAAENLVLANESVDFDARFHGRPWHIHVPMAAVQGIYAKQTGVGMVFNDEDYSPPDPDTDGEPPSDSGKKPKLKIVR